MPDHLHVDHVGTGLNWNGSTLSASETLTHGAQRYLESSANTDATTSFIDFDTDVNAGPHAVTLRDEDQTAGMYYWIRVTGNSTGTLTVQRPTSGSTKTISGKFEGQTLSAATSVVLASGELIRIRPDGANWAIY